MLEKVMKELETRFLREGDYIELTMKRTGKKLYIYRQTYGIAVYFTNGNIWSHSQLQNRENIFFPNAKNAIKGLAEYIISIK